MTDPEFAAWVEDALNTAIRLGDEGVIVQIAGAVDGVRFSIALAAKDGAERLQRVIDENSVVDPRSVE